MNSTPDNSNGAGRPRVIKRYANRKLYDTHASRYVTLHQLADLVREGEEIQIVDNTTKEDLTNVTLAQILYEQQKKGDEASRWGNRSLRGFLDESRTRLMASLREGPVGKLVHRAEDRAEPEDEAFPPTYGSWPERGRSAKEAFDDLHRVADDRVRAVVQMAMGHVQQLQGEVRRLQTRIEELEERLRGSGKGVKSDPSSPEDPNG